MAKRAKHSMRAMLPTTPSARPAHLTGAGHSPAPPRARRNGTRNATTPGATKKKAMDPRTAAVLPMRSVFVRPVLGVQALPARLLAVRIAGFRQLGPQVLRRLNA